MPAKLADSEFDFELKLRVENPALKPRSVLKAEAGRGARGPTTGLKS